MADSKTCDWNGNPGAAKYKISITLIDDNPVGNWQPGDDISGWICDLGVIGIEALRRRISETVSRHANRQVREAAKVAEAEEPQT